jgi:hypothetical protein
MEDVYNYLASREEGKEKFPSVSISSISGMQIIGRDDGNEKGLRYPLEVETLDNPQKILNNLKGRAFDKVYVFSSNILRGFTFPDLYGMGLGNPDISAHTKICPIDAGMAFYIQGNLAEKYGVDIDEVTKGNVTKTIISKEDVKNFISFILEFDKKFTSEEAYSIRMKTRKEISDIVNGIPQAV